MSYPAYYISYVVDKSKSERHSFIVVSKKMTEDSPAEIIASFGLNRRSDAPSSKMITGILSGGYQSDERGRVRSEHYYDKSLNPDKKDSSSIKLVGKSYLITDEIAAHVLKIGMKDALIDSVPKADEQKQISTPKKSLTLEENQFRKWFLNVPRTLAQGGPNYNVVDFNCHKYALYILRQAGIRDPYLESFTFSPFSLTSTTGDLRQFDLKHLNIESQSSIAITSTNYDDIYYAHETRAKAAIALLKDYVEAPFHLRRHHKKKVEQVLEKMKDSNDIAEIILEIERAIPPHRYYGGSLQKRLDYLKDHHKNESEEQYRANVIAIKEREATIVEQTVLMNSRK